MLLEALVLGTALSAASGTWAETIFGTHARLDRPFVDSDHVAFSLARMAFAGPYFLVGEAAHARGQGRCNGLLWTATILFAALWCLCLGIVSLALTSQIFDFSMLALSTGSNVYEPL